MAKAKAEEKVDLAYGDVVAVPWPGGEVKGTVYNIYEGPKSQHVVVMLTPEVSGLIVDEPTTVSWPIGDVRKIASAA